MNGDRSQESETMAMHGERERPRQALARNGGSAGEITLPCQRVGDGDSQSQQGETSAPDLPEDIWRHIHSLLPMDAAARAACLSHAFLSSWRCYPKLDLNPGTLGSELYRENFRCRADSILRNHSGIGIKTLSLNLWHERNCFPYIDGWLQVAVTPGIEELTLSLYEQYNFPCSVWSDGVRNSVRSLHLINCTFRPMPDELGILRSLTTLKLWDVHITGEELECLLSNSPALKHLDLSGCEEIILLKIPPMLKQLSYLKVSGCWNVQAIENKAPNLSRFLFVGKDTRLSLEAWQMMKVFYLIRANAIYNGCAKLPSIMPNLESLLLSSISEVDTLIMPPTKFLNLKHLAIHICGATYSSPSYNYLNLVSFLDACPSLETWHLNVYQNRAEYESVFGGSLHLSQPPEHLKLKSVEIVGFKSAKVLVELTCCIVKSAKSLERLTLNTFDGFTRCSDENNSHCRDEMCSPITKSELEEASRAVVAIRRYIEDVVPATAKLTVVEPCPCPRCRSTHMEDVSKCM